MDTKQNADGKWVLINESGVKVSAPVETEAAALTELEELKKRGKVKLDEKVSTKQILHG